MVEKVGKISEQTVIPLGFLLVVLGTLAGGIVWLADIHTTAAQARDSIVEIKHFQEIKDSQAREDLKDINDKLSRMELILGELKRRK